MTGKTYKYPNVISFFLILSPLIFSVIHTIYMSAIGSSIRLSAIDSTMVAIITQSTIYFFGILCAAFMVLFGNINKYLYPMGITVALVTTAGTFFLKIFNGPLSVSKLITSIIPVIISIAMFVSIMMALNNNEKAKIFAKVNSAIFIILMIIMACAALFMKGPDGTPLPILEIIIFFIKNLMNINIPIAVYILVSHALATGQLKDGNLKLENK